MSDPMTWLIFQNYVNSSDYAALHGSAQVDDETFAALTRTRPEDMRTLVIESTAQGDDDFYRQVIHGRVEHTPIFLPWFDA